MLDSRAAIDNLQLAIAYGHGNLGEVKNQKKKWGDLRADLAKPVVGHESLAQYKALPKQERDRLKNVGFFIGAQCAGGKRKSEAISERSMVTFDIDDGGSPELVARLELGMTDLCEYEFVMYSTRSSTPENPRLRVVLPLLKPIKADAYEALTRILASHLDLTVKDSMHAVTRESFRLAQMMYLPSMCKDGQWIYQHNEGRVIDGDQVLADFGNWRDFSLLPFSDDSALTRLSPAGKKAEDPTEKRGLIGAFCRAYDVEQAIAEFLPDTYMPGDAPSGKPRYTYVHGTTSNGAIVEDDGLFLYSYHAHDPCSERLVNAWDLVRIHRFGHLDARAKSEASPSEMPSYKAMAEFAQGLPGVVAEQLQDQYDRTAMFKDYGPEEPDPVDAMLGVADDPLGLSATEMAVEWMKGLELTPKGEIKNTVTNIWKIVCNDPRFRNTVQLNQFTGNLVTRAPVRSQLAALHDWRIDDPVNGDMWSDWHDQYLRVILEESHGPGKIGYGLKVTDRDLAAAVDLAARSNAFHPVKNYLEACRWDGVSRLETYLIDYVGAPDTPYIRAVSRIWLTAAVARIYEPGHKFDFVLILEGVQGKGKSSFFNALAASWFKELKGDFNDPQKLIELQQGAWLVEVPELSQFKKSQVEEIKAFCSSQEDVARMAYARRTSTIKRQCVYGGSTNKTAYLHDPTGGRRFWGVPVRIDSIPIERIDREAPALWAEALAEYRRMRTVQPYGRLPLYLADKSVEADAKEMQESRRQETEEDVMLGMIEAWLDEPAKAEGTNFHDLGDENDPLAEPSMPMRHNEVCGMQVWVECFGENLQTYLRGAQLRMHNCLERMPGWSAAGRAYTKKYGRQRIFQRIGFGENNSDPLS